MLTRQRERMNKSRPREQIHRSCGQSGTVTEQQRHEHGPSLRKGDGAFSAPDIDAAGAFLRSVSGIFGKRVLQGLKPSKAEKLQMPQQTASLAHFQKKRAGAGSVQPRIMPDIPVRPVCAEIGRPRIHAAHGRIQPQNRPQRAARHRTSDAFEIRGIQRHAHAAGNRRIAAFKDLAGIPLSSAGQFLGHLPVQCPGDVGRGFGRQVTGHVDRMHLLQNDADPLSGQSRHRHDATFRKHVSARYRRP